MTEAVVMTSLISLAVVTIVALLVSALVLRGSSDRSERVDRVLADLLTKAVNAAVVSESDQVSRIDAEKGRETSDLPPPGVFASVPQDPANQWETVGEARNDSID